MKTSSTLPSRVSRSTRPRVATLLIALSALPLPGLALPQARSAVGPSAPAGQIRALRLVPIPDGTELRVLCSGPVDTVGSQLYSDSILVAQLLGLLPGPGISDLHPETGPVSDVLIVGKETPQGPLTRIMIRPREPAEYALSMSGNEVHVRVRTSRSERGSESPLAAETVTDRGSKQRLEQLEAQVASLDAALQDSRTEHAELQRTLRDSRDIETELRRRLDSCQSQEEATASRNTEELKRLRKEREALRENLESQQRSHQEALVELGACRTELDLASSGRATPTPSAPAAEPTPTAQPSPLPRVAGESGPPPAPTPGSPAAVTPAEPLEATTPASQPASGPLSGERTPEPLGSLPGRHSGPGAGTQADPQEEGTGGFSTIEGVTWSRTAQGRLEVVIRTDGPVRKGSYKYVKLEKDRPRLLMRFLGVERCRAPATLAVDQPEVELIRTARHIGSEGEDELHVVLDLPSRDVFLVSAAPEGSSFVVVLQRSSRPSPED